MILKKSRAQLDAELTELLVGKDMNKIKTLLSRNFRVCVISKLYNEQVEKFILIVKDALYKGEL